MVEQPLDGIIRRVEFPDAGCAVSMLSEVAEKTWEIPRMRPAESKVAMVVAVLSGEQADPAGCANWILCVGMAERHTLAGQTVHTWGDRLRMCLIASASRQMLVGDDEQNIER
jgi:hypothetical protein